MMNYTMTEKEKTQVRLIKNYVFPKFLEKEKSPLKMIRTSSSITYRR